MLLHPSRLDIRRANAATTVGGSTHYIGLVALQFLGHRRSLGHFKIAGIVILHVLRQPAPCSPLIVVLLATTVALYACSYSLYVPGCSLPHVIRIIMVRSLSTNRSHRLSVVTLASPMQQRIGSHKSD